MRFWRIISAAGRVLQYSPLILVLLLSIFVTRTATADATFIYAVQISAVVQSDPPQITLNWEPDPYGVTNYTIYRKVKEDTSWGNPIAELDGSNLSYTDYNVAVGGAYEYQIVAQDNLGVTAYGYIFSGIEAPMIDHRGTLLLVIETNATATLGDDLAQLQSDLVGDGWQVISFGVSSNDSSEDVRNLIMQEYYSNPQDVNALFLFGHVPVLESGDLNYDGHEARAMPADTYYGDMLDDWPIPSDPTNGVDYLPSDVVLMIGRADFFDMPGEGAPVPWPSETELLQNYLHKDHNWRMKQIAVQRLALMGDSRGDEDGPLAEAASGYRNFEPFVGPGNIIEANVQYGAPIDERWISMLGAGSYLWAYGNGGGAPNGVSGLGTNSVAGTDSFLFSTDVVGIDAQVVFVMLFGSWFGEWDLQDDLMRSFLATPTMGLACVESGVPHWFFHHMGLGETIGYSTRLTMNNSMLYQNEENDLTRAIYIALMGDPTLRMEPVVPPSGLNAIAGAGAVSLNWGASSDPVAGYHVYRAAGSAGPFTRLTDSLVAGTTFTDTTVSPNSTYTYMVRAVLLENNFSGSYYNPSQGIFANVSTISALNPITLSATLSINGMLLNWNTLLGSTYHVMATSSLTQPQWTDLSGSIVAPGPSTSWLDSNIGSSQQRFYRISTP